MSTCVVADHIALTLPVNATIRLEISFETFQCTLLRYSTAQDGRTAEVHPSALVFEQRRLQRGAPAKNQAKAVCDFA
jgi:hypothetical protein